MVEISRWKSRSREIINSVVESNPKDENLVKLIDAAYPFGERANHPYKVWLQVRKDTLLRLGLYKVPFSRECKYHPNGQLCLICGFKNDA